MLKSLFERWFHRACIGFLLLQAAPAAAEDEVFVPLWNGKDFSGWVNVNCAPSTWSVGDGVIVCTGKPTGVLRTVRQYENFILELEWKHLRKGGNAGVFVHSDPLTARGVPFTRAIEVQVIDGDDPKGMWTGHGDVFSIHGASFVPDRPHPGGWERCLPSEKRARPAGEWNHYRIESRDGKLTLAVNGKVVSGGTRCRPRQGYICLESEGSEVHFRNLRIHELPGSNPPPEEVAELDQGFRTLYSGVDLSGWKTDPGHAGHWRPRDNWMLSYDGASEAREKDLWTAKEYGDFVLIADWRLPGKKDGEGKKADAGDSGIYLRGNSKSQVNIWCAPEGSGEVHGYRVDEALPAEVRSAVVPRKKADREPGQWNRFVITLRGEELTVELNGETVIEKARLPGVPRRGAIGLQHHGDPVEFANLYIKELD